MSKRKEDPSQIVHNNTVKQFKPKTKNQYNYLRTVIENDVTICMGPAGCGKTFCAIGLACQYLTQGKVDKVLIARPAVEASKNGIGALKGDLWEKIRPYMYPSLDHLDYFLGPQLQHFIESKEIQLEPLEFLRGRNYHKTFMILDESQSATLDQLIMFVTRIGEGSKMVIAGDPLQTDIPKNGEFRTDLEYMVDKIRKANLDRFGLSQLDISDILRNPIIGPFLEVFNK